MEKFVIKQNLGGPIFQVELTDTTILVESQKQSYFIELDQISAVYYCCKVSIGIFDKFSIELEYKEGKAICFTIDNSPIGNKNRLKELKRFTYSVIEKLHRKKSNAQVMKGVPLRLRDQGAILLIVSSIVLWQLNTTMVKIEWLELATFIAIIISMVVYSFRRKFAQKITDIEDILYEVQK